jgi:hypothetical protein
VSVICDCCGRGPPIADGWALRDCKDWEGCSVDYKIRSGEFCQEAPAEQAGIYVAVRINAPGVHLCRQCKVRLIAEYGVDLQSTRLSQYAGCGQPTPPVPPPLR